MTLHAEVRYTDGKTRPLPAMEDTPANRRAADRAAWALLADPKVESIHVNMPRARSLAVYAPRYSCPSCLSEMIRNVPMDDGEPRRRCVKCRFEWLEGEDPCDRGSTS